MTFKGIATPIIPVEVKGKLGWVRIWAYVDSGASYSLFGVEEAERLGIDFKKGKEGKITNPQRTCVVNLYQIR